MNDIKLKPSVVKNQQKVYVCNFCDQSFTHRSNKYRHQKFRCHNNPDAITEKTEQKISTIEQGEDMNINLSELKGDDIKSVLGSILKSTIENQNQKIEEMMNEKLTELIEKKFTGQRINIENQNNINNNITIYINEKVDFVQALQDIYGWDEAKAINHIKERISQNNEGDIHLFCDIYLVGKKENWPIVCKDKKNGYFLIKDRKKNALISDPGGVEIFKNFKRNYTDTLLRLSEREIKKVTSQKTETPDYEVKRDYLLDEFDLGLMQNKMFSLCNYDHKVFIKKLSNHIDNHEKKEKYSQDPICLTF